MGATASCDADEEKAPTMIPDEKPQEVIKEVINVNIIEDTITMSEETTSNDNNKEPITNNVEETIKIEENISIESDTNPLLPPGEDEPVGLIKEDGSINWDCPCLQGMGNGPCGEEFKDAFACFHYSEEEPKGANCLEQFKAMQDCFLKHPEIYGGLDDDLEELEAEEAALNSSSREEIGESTNIDNNQVENVTEQLDNVAQPNS